MPLERRDLVSGGLWMKYPACPALVAIWLVALLFPAQRPPTDALLRRPEDGFHVAPLSRRREVRAAIPLLRRLGQVPSGD
jgi:hypothetical protein